MCNLEKKTIVFTKNFQNVKIAIAKEVQNVTMIIKMKYQVNEKHIMKKNRDTLLQKQNDRYKNFKRILRCYVDLENNLKALEENLSKNDSKNNQNL